MITHSSTSSASQGEKAWLKLLARYKQPNRGRSVFELAVTVLPLAALWALSWAALSLGWWWGLVLTIPAAGFLVRLFMIQHDCGHGAFFGQRDADDWTGRAISILTLTPYDCWRRAHAMHHATSGDLDQRGIGDIVTLTVAEYQARSAWGRFTYRFYRHPVVLFGLGPAWLFLIQQRLPFGLMRAGATPWISTMVTNLVIAALAVGLIWLIGIVPFLLVHVPIVLIASTAGVWLFYVQHQFEDTHWSEHSDWQFQQAALHGSSYYDLPVILRWFTANIGIHHVHHMSSKVPYYRLPEVLRDYPELKKIGRITLFDSFRGVKLTLWDEGRRKLVSFREALAR
jgi:acyl-lipid omega-6 desaturase (Delta-12 desaturase)